MIQTISSTVPNLSEFTHINPPLPPIIPISNVPPIAFSVRTAVVAFLNQPKSSINATSSALTPENVKYDDHYKPLLPLSPDEQKLFNELETSIVVSPKDLDDSALSEEALFSNVEELFKEHLMHILKHEYDKVNDEWCVYKPFGKFRVFSIGPNLIYKLYINGTEKARERYNNLKMARKICCKLNLNMIKTPRSKLFITNAGICEIAIIAQERLNVEEGCGINKFSKHNKLNPNTYKQLLIFLCETQYYDFIDQNVAVLPDDRIGFIDLESLNTGSTSLWDASNIAKDKVSKGILEAIARQYERSIALFTPSNNKTRRTRCPNILREHNEDHDPSEVITTIPVIPF